jgi:phage tail-like protein
LTFSIPTFPELDSPLLGFRFGVFVFGNSGISHPLDFRFQSVSGLSVRVELSGEESEGTNKSKRALPERVKYENLSLKRGLPLFSTLRMEVHKSLDQFRFSPRNVLVSILDENALPMSSWMFSEAFPVKWSISELDADSNAVLIEELELKYKNFKPMML